MQCMGEGSQRALPSGLVTFVFTDIEGSTELLRSRSAEYQALLDLHHECLRQVWAAHRGAEVATEGDAFFVAFDSAEDAVAAMVAGQRSLAEVQWPIDLPVRVRMGAHSGYAQPRHDDYAALAVNQAARIVSAAHGAQVLVSQDTAQLVAARPADVRLVPLGKFRVRDFAEPVELHEVRAPGIERQGAVPRVRPAEGHNLLQPATEMLGRNDALHQLHSLVAPHKVVTLVGPGGIGKTRLAIEHGLVAAPRWPDGVWFVDLSAVTTPERVDDAVATGIGASAVPGRETRIDIVEHLRERQALIILDNCEHLGTGPAHLAHTILMNAPGVALLATSRSPLQLRAETVHRLQPLATNTAEAPAIQLFLERSGDVAADELPAVQDLCATLDGLPLAIELAAARSRLIGPTTLRELMGGSLSLIESADPTLPDRQRTLERVLDWSYDLLHPPEQQLLRRLSVFATSADLDVILHAWPEDDDLGTIERTLSLVDSSLLEPDGTSGGTRFRMPATVRTYAQGRSDPDELASATSAIGRIYQDRLGPEQAMTWGWVSDLAVELDNLRMVLSRLTHDHQLAQRLAWSIGQYHDLIRAFATGIDELSGYAERFDTPSPDRVALLTQLADLALRVDDLDLASRVLAEAQKVQRHAGAPAWDDACTARTEGELFLRQGDAERAVRLARSTLASARSPRSRARLLNLLGIASATVGSLADAIEAFREELPALTQAGMETFIGTTHGNLAEAYLLAGDAARAARNQLRALEEARSNRDSIQVALSVLVAARLASSRSQAARAVELQTAAQLVLTEAGFVLYDTDRATADELVVAARAELGPDRLAVAEQRGSEIGLAAAADVAEAVLGDGTVFPSTD